MPFTNLDGTTPDKSLRELLRWSFAPREPTRPFVTPRRENDGASLREPGAHLTWIGHASFVARLGGRLVAIDPVWGRRLGTVRRNVAPGVPLRRLPALDLTLITHSHFDHLELSTLRGLGRATPCLVPKKLGRLVRRAGLEHVVELDWWQSHEAGELRVTLVPAHHWSMRLPWDRNRTLWGGYVLESPEGTLYHAGDTAFRREQFEAIRARFPKVDWALLPIGAYAPAWFMSPQHMNPEEAGEAFEALGARRLVPMHWGAFRLSDEWLGEPPERMRAWWHARGLERERLWMMEVGESRKLEGRL